MIFIGIDPGLTGAIAALSADGRCIAIFDTPVLTVLKNKKPRHEPDRLQMAKVLSDISLVEPGGRNVAVAIEKVNAMPDQGVTSVFSFGMGFGIWLGILASLELPTDLVHPTRWKKVMMDGMGKEKDASRLRAKELFGSSVDLSLKKHHGRADALLLAEYRRRLG